VKRLRTYQYYALLVLVYILIVLVMRPNPMTLQAYHLEPLAYRVLLLAINGIPAFLTWFAAFYGYEQLRRYHKTVAGSKEGTAFGELTRASKWLALYLPVASLISLILNAVANVHLPFRATASIITNYAVVVMALMAMSAFGNGGRLLADTVKSRPGLGKTRFLVLCFIAMGILYCYLVIRHSLEDSHAYYMPLALLLITVVVPLFYAWCSGLMAALDITAYATKVTGVLYKRALRGLSAGIIAIIAGAILLQYLSSVSPPRGRLIIGSSLLLRYLLYACLAGGFLLIGNAAKKLQQIEKI
jgi:hypothetical protein